MNAAILIITGAFAAVCTYVFNEKLRQGPVRSSAALSLSVGLFFYFFPNLLSGYLTTNIPIVFIGSSFIGMVSSSVVHNYYIIATSGVIFSLIYLNTSKFFTGYGGTLGTAACISLLVAISLPFFLNRKKISNGYLVLRKLIFHKNKAKSR
ncbi:hypothetical protein [Pontibacter sp. SGAir0037]|uniref:hypothetical protein n=1 Tax=Pontibacter sp. SGAir0037 TaxID=2571030 RepID=UPI0010CCE9D9|nr:hypothetical protein [Pontibacter sp. SGAir0037]QCR23425.1 hypothetical protein C1N53_14485 [Pontibacter sp. SGAir0037]